MTDASGQTSLLVPLRIAQKFYFLRGAILVVVWSVVLAVFAFGLLPRIIEPAALPPGWNVAALSAVTTLVAGGALLVFGAKPTIADLARRADSRFNLGERLSAALATPLASSGPAAALTASLLRDASERARLIAPRRLEPFLTKGVAASGGLLIAVLLAIWFLPTDTSRVPNSTAGLDISVPLDTEVRAANLSAIAEVLAGDAERRQNSYLGAVAEAVAELARNADPNMPAEQFQKNLSGLLDHARLAYGAGSPAWLRGAQTADNRYDLLQDRNLAEMASQALTSKPVILPNGGGGEELVPELFSEREPSRNASSAPMVPGQFRAAKDEADLKIGSPNIGREGSNANTAEGEAKQASAGGAAPSLGTKDAAELETIEGAAALLAGGATQSGAGASRVAGQGTQVLEDGPQSAAAEIGRGEDVMLPAGNYRQGKRIRLQIAPQAAAAEGAEHAGDLSLNAGRSEPVAVSRDTPSLRDQEIFSRMFMHQEGAGAP